jgi:hypothetical protein
LTVADLDADNKMMNMLKNRELWRWIVLAAVIFTLVVWGVRTWDQGSRGSTAAGDEPEEVYQLQLVPTFTPTPATVEATGSVQAGIAMSNSRVEAPALVAQAPTATPVPSPTLTPLPVQRLDEAAELHRFGYYSEEQQMLLALTSDAGANPVDRLEARYRG